MEIQPFKKLLVFMFVAIMISALANHNSLTPHLARGQVLPTISVDPASIVDDTLTPGSTFTVDLLIADANIDEGTEAYGWQVMMSWNSTVLDVVDAGLSFGDFMDVPRIGPWGTLTADAVAGQNVIYVWDGRKFANPAAWGGKVLIQDDFNSEINIVVGNEGNRLTLQNNLANSYTVAAGGGAYPWPTLAPAFAVGPARNRVMVGQSTMGAPPGVSGSGWLATLTFEVLATGETTLAIDAPFLGETQTFIVNTSMDMIGDEPGELNKENGYFSNGAPPEEYALTIAVDGAGTTDPVPGVYLYAEGIIVDVDALPDAGYHLDRWELDGVDVGAADPYSVTMDADHVLTAFFVSLGGPLIYVDPAVISVDPPGSFTINVSIADVVDLFSYEVKLGYDPSILEIAGIDEGPFIKDQTTSPLGTLWYTVFGADYVYAACVTLGAYPGVSGSGTLFNVTFNVISYGETVLDLYDSTLLDSTGTEIFHDTADGYFSTSPAPQHDLTLAVVGPGTTDPAPGVHTYDEGSVVSVHALPDSGYTLDYWTLDGVDVGAADPYSVTVDADHSLVAFFVEYPGDHDEMFSDVYLWPFDSDGDGYDDAVSVEMDVDTTYNGTLGVEVDAYVISPYGRYVDEDFPFWDITGTAVEFGYAYLYVPVGSPDGWYNVELWLYDEWGHLEDYAYFDDVFFYIGSESGNEYFYSVVCTPFDSNGDGYDDAVEVAMDVDTTYNGTLSVEVEACLIDPYGGIVAWDFPFWNITGTAVEFGYAYLYVPVDSSVGWYDVELWLYDAWGNSEDYLYIYNAAYLYPSDVSPPEFYDEYFDSVVCTPFDSNGDGYDDAVEVAMDVDTTYNGTLGVHVDAYLIDPYGSYVTWNYAFWYITSTAVEYGYTYLYAPAGSPEGWYDVELWLYDAWGNSEDYLYIYDASYLYPLSIDIFFSDAYLDDWVDNDGDGVHGSVRANWNADVSDMVYQDVYVEIWGVDSSDYWVYLGSVGPYTTYDYASDWYSFTIDVPYADSWDIVLELYDWDPWTLEDEWWFLDVLLESSVDDAIDVFFWDAYLSDFVDDDGDGYYSRVTTTWDADANGSAFVDVYVAIWGVDSAGFWDYFGSYGPYAIYNYEIDWVSFVADNVSHADCWDIVLELYNWDTVTLEDEWWFYDVLMEPLEVETAWDVLLNASLGSFSDVSDFGVRNDATNGFDPAYDALDPPPPPGSGVVSYFWYPDNPTSPVDLRKLSTSKIAPTPPMTWTYIVRAQAVSGTMTISWTAEDIAAIPDEYPVYLYVDGLAIDMRNVTQYSFTAEADVAYTCLIMVGPVSYDLPLSAGWNLVSFAVLPPDSNFTSIFGAVGFYQVCTWDGSGYVEPLVAEAGWGYWVLVLDDVTVTVTGLPVMSYARDLPVGWSLLGAIYPCVVNANLVFSEYYQLYTWDGSGYVLTYTIEPWVGYWVVVLEPTSIVVDESHAVTATPSVVAVGLSESGGIAEPDWTVVETACRDPDNDQFSCAREEIHIASKRWKKET